MIVRELHDADCYSLIRSERIARLACCKEDRPYIVPIQYAYHLNRLISFSMPGQKIEIMRHNPKVCAEIEHLTDRQHWRCVIIEGRFHEMKSAADRQMAWQAMQDFNDWWEPGSLKPSAPHLTHERAHLFYEIIIESISGREALPG